MRIERGSFQGETCVVLEGFSGSGCEESYWGVVV